MRAIALVVLAAAGCFNPTFDSGQFSCARSGDVCPDGYHCSVDLSCWKSGHDPAQLGAFAVVQSTALTTGRRGAVASVIGTSLYVMGGLGITGAEGSIEKAQVKPDLSLDLFAPAPSALSTPRASATGVKSGGFFYLVGGKDGPSFLDTIERAPIGDDGAPGLFAPVLPTLQTRRSEHSLLQVGDRAYVIGGLSNGGALSSVEQTVIFDGAHPFLPASSLTQPRASHASVVVDGKFLYVIGGAGGGAPLDSVEVATLAGDGTLGAFSIVPGVTLKAARSGHAVLVLDRLLYVLGGEGRIGVSDTALNSVERSVIGTDGTLGPFEVLQDVSLERARLDFALVAIGRYIYLVGGDDLSGLYLKDVERASAK